MYLRSIFIADVQCTDDFVSFLYKKDHRSESEWCKAHTIEDSGYALPDVSAVDDEDKQEQLGQLCGEQLVPELDLANPIAAVNVRAHSRDMHTHTTHTRARAHTHIITSGGIISTSGGIIYYFSVTKKMFLHVFR